MRALALPLLGLLAACASTPENPCKDVPTGGACLFDDECALATCASACCGGWGRCGEGAAFARADLSKHPCMVETGKSAPPTCHPPFDCPCPFCAALPSVARCVDGRCAAVPAQGADAGP
jgi:hypothetical protein